jgi:hypothetical protein
VPITFRCPDGHKLSVADTLAGRKARCPVCRRKMYIPLDNAEPHQRARPAPEKTPEASDVAEAVEPTSTTLVVPVSLENPPPAPPVETSDFPLEALDVPQPQPGELPPPKKRPNIYRPDPDKVQTVRLLAIALALTALFTAGPVAWHPNLLAAPDWVRLVVLFSLLQLAYVAWMASLPDWVTVWVAMLINALVATLYGAALAIFLYTPVDAPLGLGLESVVRRTAAGWCLAVVLVTTMMAFACGRVCALWRRADEWKRRRALL